LSAADANSVRVIVVDDSPPFRDLLKDVVNATPGMTCVGALSSGADAIAAVAASAPELVIIDKRMPGMDGVEATRQILARAPETVVVLISVEQPKDGFLRESGAAAFLNKRELSARALTELWERHGRPCPDPEH
jgi:chemotaxis response regulator CheB